MAAPAWPRGWGVPYSVHPLHPDMAAGGDAGVPVATAGDDTELGVVFKEMARVIAEDVAPTVDVQGCSARMLGHVEAAVAQADTVLGLETAGGARTQAAAQRVPMVSSVRPLRRRPGTGPALLAQRTEMRPQREPGDRELFLGHVPVHLLPAGRRPFLRPDGPERPRSRA